ncbi:MAG: RluA family pseudouridine synthase [Anaerolineaceae bacterium]|nr:RluA family pseudouridine synthase [Anaerolineaceae bacterium]
MMSLTPQVFAFSGQEPERLDHYLTVLFPDLSRSRLQKIIKGGGVCINDVETTKNGTMLSRGDEVSILVPEPKETVLEAEDIPLDILYEDEQCLVINKSAGMVVHPSAGHQQGTLVHAVLAHVPETMQVGGVERPGVVHRLDKDTSGILVMAKTDQAHQWLQKQFKERLVVKKYLALVEGHPPTPVGRIEAPLARDPKDRLRMAILNDARGKPATTIYKTLHRYRDYSYLQVDILTGRTHQIRVHMKFLGCPVVGDTLYGRKRTKLTLARQFLHAVSIDICLPGNDTPTHFDTALPSDLQSVLNELD